MPGWCAFYLVALSLGVVLITWRGSNADAMRVLFGTVLAIDHRALIQIAAISSVIVLAVAALYRPFAVGAIDPTFLRCDAPLLPYQAMFVVRGTGAGGKFPGIRALLALGPMLLPAAAACRWRSGVAASIALAVLFGLAASLAGLLISYHANLPSGPAIVLTAGSLFVVSHALQGAMQFVWGRADAAFDPADRRAARRPSGARRRTDRRVATFSVVGDMLANVGGDHVRINTIVGPDGDCELYQPTVADVAHVAAARAVFLNDLNEEFEPWLEPLLKQAEFHGAKIVVFRGVRTLTAEEEHPVSGRPLPTAIDQHAWLDPRNGAVYVRNIAEALARLDAANAADYRARAADYTKDPGAGRLGAQGARRSSGGQATGAVFPRLAPVHCQCLWDHAAVGGRLDQQGRAVRRRTREAGAAGPRQRVKALFLDSITDPARHTAHRRRDRCQDRRHDVCRLSVAAGRRGRQLPQNAAT